MAHVNPVLNQTDFRGREDSGNEATPTWIDIANNDWTQDVDVDFRVRMVVAETAGSSSAATVGPVIWYSLNAGAYAEVTASSPVQFATFTGATDDDATTQQVGSGAFVTGRLDSNAAVTTADIQNSETEYEYCLTIDSAQVANNDTIGLRVYDAGAALDAYGNTPTVTVNEGAAAQTITGASYVDADAFGTGIISTGAVAIVGASYINLGAFGTGSIATSGGTQTITGAAYADGDAFGSAALSTSYEITGLSHSDPDVFGTGIISTGAVAIVGVSYADPDAFGTGIISTGAVTIAGASYQDPDVFGVGSLSTSYEITGLSHSDPDVFGVGSVSAGVATIGGASYVDADAFGSGVVVASGGPQTITGLSHVDADAFGSGTISTVGVPQSITGASLVDADVFGSGAMGSVYNIDGSPYVDADAFGSGAITTGTTTITGVSFANVAAFGYGSIVGGTFTPAADSRTFAEGIKLRKIIAEAKDRVFVESEKQRSVTG